MSEEANELPNMEQGTQAKAAAPVMGGIFGITSETKESNNVPIPVAKKLTAPHATFPSGWQFPKAKLVNVVSEPEYKRKDGELVARLLFIFRDIKGRQFMHVEWAQDLTQDSEKLKKKTDGLNTRIKHIHIASFGPWDEDMRLGEGVQTYAEYFNIVENEFNSRVDEAKVKIYSKHEVYLKLVYWKTNLNFPLSPNFIEKVNSADPVCRTLGIHIVHDKLEPTKTDLNVPGMAAGGTPTGDLPAFDGGYA